MPLGPPTPLESQMMLLGCGSSGSGFAGALDAYTTDLAGAWSVSRRLLTSHTGSLIRIRRSSDSTEQDIGFNGQGALDTAAIASFVGANNAFVVTIYDQSGAGRHFTQATAASQRRIVAAGVVDTLSSLPTAKASANDQGYATATFTAYTGTKISGFARASFASSYAFERILSASKNTDPDFTATTRLALMVKNNAAQSINSFRLSAISNAVAITFGTGFVASVIFTGSNSTMTVGLSSQSAASSGAFDVNRYLLGMESSLNGKTENGSCWSEGAIYHEDKTADAAAIRAALTP